MLFSSITFSHHAWDYGTEKFCKLIFMCVFNMQVLFTLEHSYISSFTSHSTLHHSKLTSTLVSMRPPLSWCIAQVSICEICISRA